MIIERKKRIRCKCRKGCPHYFYVYKYKGMGGWWCGIAGTYRGGLCAAVERR